MSKYTDHVKCEMKKGKSMKEAASSWKKKGSPAKKKKFLGMF